MSASKSKSLTIQMAAELSGVSAHTIRAWEKRYQALTPVRTESGRRAYTQAEVDRLILLSSLIQLGSSIGQIAHLPELELNNIYLKISNHSSPLLPEQEQKVNVDLKDSLLKLLVASKKYEMDKISSLLEDLKKQIDPKEMALKILSPLLDEVRDLQEKEVISLAQVKALKAILKFHAGGIIFSQYEKKMKSQIKIALTTLEGDHQNFELLLATLICCHHKLNLFYLNSNLPAGSIVEAVNAIEANILVLTIGKDLQKSDLSLLIHKILSHISNKIRVCLIGEVSLPSNVTNEWKNLSIVSSLEELDLYLGKL